MCPVPGAQVLRDFSGCKANGEPSPNCRGSGGGYPDIRPAFAAVFKSGGKQPFHRRSDPEQATVVAIPCHQHQSDRQPTLARQRQGDRAEVEEIDPRRVAHDRCLLAQEGFDRSDL